jgi:signal transduction histidine kinase
MSPAPVPSLPFEDDPTLRLEDQVEQALRLAAMREHSLLSLSELSQNLSASPDLFSMADLVLFNLLGQFGTPRAALWLLSSTDRSAVLIRSHGISRTLARAAGAACASMLASDAGVYPPPVPKRLIGDIFGPAARVIAERADIGVVATITSREVPIGLVALGHRIGGLDYGAMEINNLQAACAVLGAAVQNLNLQTRMVENNLRLRRANEELQELDRLKSEILSNVSHELRTPLTVIIGYLEVMQDATMTPDRGQEIVPIVMAEARKLNGMVGNLLTLSASNQGDLALQLESGDVAAPLRDYCEERRPLITSGLREFTWSIEPGLPLVRFDRARLLQVIEALVENAVKFTPQGTHLSVNIRPAPENPALPVAIEVTDDGPGIAPYQLPHLFETFQQGDGSATRAIGGMGIGLSSSRKVIDAMGGRIEVHSELGVGTTFTIHLPAAPDRRIPSEAR